jgi:hypothetical protein
MRYENNFISVHFENLFWIFDDVIILKFLKSIRYEILQIIVVILFFTEISTQNFIIDRPNQILNFFVQVFIFLDHLNE